MLAVGTEYTAAEPNGRSSFIDFRNGEEGTQAEA